MIPDEFGIFFLPVRVINAEAMEARIGLAR